ncbi:MAG: MurR/RpiR family transcriptional regulator [Hyphomicrobiales bacterium]|nr:MurR/RpiR family transcriptional regulator [Hyphomicrobiales bacterium]
MHSNSNSSVQEKIVTNIHSLSPRLRVAANYVADHPDEIASRSLRYNAIATELTPPTFSRLARALGYENYELLRDACRNQIKKQRLTFADKAKVLQEGQKTGNGSGDFVLRHGSAAIDNIGIFLNTIDPLQVDEVAKTLIKARRVHLVGMMSSRHFVDYMEYMASMAFENWRVLGGKPASMASTLADINKQDVILAICHTPYAKRSVEIARFAHNAGAQVIGITDNVISPLAAVSDAVLIVNTESPQFFSSHIATLVLIESIIGISVAKSGKTARERIAAVEQTSHNLGEYWSNKE